MTNTPLFSMSHSGLGLWLFFNSVQKCDIEFSFSLSLSQKSIETFSRMSQSPEEGGGLDGGASGVITPREGGLKPVSMGRGVAGRGGGQTSAERKQKSRAAVRARSSTVTAGAASGLAVQGTVASPADVVADAVASPAEETPAYVYSSPAHKMWRDKDKTVTKCDQHTAFLNSMSHSGLCMSGGFSLGIAHRFSPLRRGTLPPMYHERGLNSS